MRAYLDSCVVIYLVEGAQPWAGLVADALADAPEAEQVVSDLVRLECTVLPLRTGNHVLLQSFAEYFAQCEMIASTSVVFDRAASLRARHNIKTPDALHLAAALEGGCDEFWTNDYRLRNAVDGLQLRVFAST